MSGVQLNSGPASVAELALVPIRGGSKGLPGKNLRPLAGKPLFVHAVEQGLECAKRCLISTDIEEILSSGGPNGSEVLRRPAALADDNARMDGVIADAIMQSGCKTGTMVLLQATTPLRRTEDIQSALDLFAKGDYDLVLSVTATSSGPLKYGFMADGVFSPVSDPAYCFSNRQSLPALFRPNGAVFVFGIDWFLKHGSLAAERIGAIEMDTRRSFDIDTLEDLQRVEDLLNQDKMPMTARHRDKE